jgi:beta-lactamase class A
MKECVVRVKGFGLLMLAIFCLPASAVVFATGALVAPASQIIESPQLESEINRIAKNVSGTVGVAAMHLESGRLFLYNGQDHFPMASTYKLPIAVQGGSGAWCTKS